MSWAQLCPGFVLHLIFSDISVENMRAVLMTQGNNNNNNKQTFQNASNTKLFLQLIRFYSLPVHITFAISLPSSLRDPLVTGHTLLHPQAQSSLKITNRSFRYTAPHLWNKLPPSLRCPCQSQSATSECSPPGSDSAPKSVVGVSHRVFRSRLKTHLFSRSFPP